MSTPGSNPPIGLSNTPYYVRQNQDWAIQQERYRHDQAMYTIGELALFILMWKVEDFKNGYVRRCSRCYGNGADDSVSARASKAYNQPTKNECPMCYGTTFEGGVRAKIIRPAVFTDTDDQERLDKHGTSYPQTLSVETTSDFRYRNMDYVFRADGSRWVLAAPSRVTVRTGFGHPGQAQDSIGYSASMATLEDKTTVSWMIPPNQDDLMAMLTPQGHYPVAQFDLINAPLIPNAYTD